MAGRICTRADDEQLLSWLSKLDAGMTVAQVARASGVRPQKVSVAVNRVREADRAAHGEAR